MERFSIHKTEIIFIVCIKPSTVLDISARWSSTWGMMNSELLKNKICVRSFK